MQNLFTKLALVLLLGALGSGVTTVVNAQTGTIRGQVMDGEFNEPLIGATVVLEGTTIGANTDIDGQFAFNNVPVGTYTVKISYVSYETLSITDVVVEAGKVTVVEPVLKPAESSVGEVVITAKALAVSEASLLNLQIKAAQTLDGLGSRQISRIGDSDAGGAIRRVVGVTVEGGKYVYVRGLGDRYGKTLVNGAEIPGLDPTRNSVQIDLFPTNVLDNLVIYKAFTPDLPGSFTGGLVDITTRDFPDQFSLQISVSASYNTQSTFNDEWLTYEGSNKDWLGLGFKDRDIPQFVRDNPQFVNNRNSSIADGVNQATEEFGPQWVPTTEAAPLDHNIQISLGNQTQLWGKTLGYIFAVSYRRQYTLFEGNASIWELQNATDNQLRALQDFADVQGSNEVLWSALGNVSLKFNDRNKISLNLTRTQSGQSNTRFLEGLRLSEEVQNFQQIRILDYNQRSNTILQLRGTHALGTSGWDIDWLMSGALTENFQPDFRTWAFLYQVSGGVPDFSSAQINQGSTGIPVRFFRELDETNVDLKFNITKNFKTTSEGKPSKLKFGGAWLNRVGRKFSERQYNYNVNVPFTGARSLSSFVLQNNIQGFFNDPNNDYTPNDPGNFNGFFYSFEPNFLNDYTAGEDIFAGYTMVDLYVTPKLRIVTGVRLETTIIEVEPSEDFFERPGTENFDGELDIVDYLPALNLIYNLSERANLRFNYGRTVARPVFREIAPFSQFDFFSGPTTIGNANLDRSLIDNLDMRYEFFPKTTEVFAITAYYKKIQLPIEKIVSVAESDVENLFLTWQNVPDAVVYGFELDIRKDLGFINAFFERFQLSLNATYTKSEVKISESELQQLRLFDPSASDTRELFGQSPYVVNAAVAYQHQGTTATIAFNRFGERLILVSFPGTPNYYEQPRNSLDINFQQKLGGENGRYTLRIGAQNILNPSTRWTADYQGTEYDYLSYKEGSRYTLGITYTITK